LHLLLSILETVNILRNFQETAHEHRSVAPAEPMKHATLFLRINLLLALLGAGAALSAEAPASLILVNGRIYTMNPAQPWADAMAVRGERIAAVGVGSDVLRLKGPATQIVDLQGGFLTPGLIDSHVHFFDGGRYLRNVALRDATTLAEVIRRVGQYNVDHPHGDWIEGEGWSYGYPDMPNGEFHKEPLDRVSGRRPVFLDSSMAHAAWVNSEALRRAGITRDTPNPAGGEIVRGVDGEATGWLKEEAAIRLVQTKIPAPSPEESTASLLAAIHEANRLGLTRVDSAGGDFDQLPRLAAIEREGNLTLRISIADWINPPGLTRQHLAVLEAARSRYHDAFLSCCVAKFLMDGVIESHTAYLPGGYADKPSEMGMRFFAPDAYKASVLTLYQHHFQVYTHAIGDGAIKLALDAYEAAQAGQGLGRDGPRNRVEHGEAPDAQDIPRFGQLGVIASMQPLMIYPRDEWKGMEGLWREYAGEQFLPTAFAIRSLLDTHAVVAFGTDWPVVQLNPLLGIRNAVLRQSLDGQPAGGYVPAQRISVAQALRAYTLDAAYASRAEADEGSIKVGKLADVVLFSENLMEISPNDIPGAKVLLTLVGGKIVHRSPD
jgi:predicted amidohydrolase YtcJ